MAEQSPVANSETPRQHEQGIEDRILNLLEPEADSPEVKQEPAPEVKAEDSQEQPEAKTEEVTEEKEEALPEVVEAELDGKTYKVPPAVKEAMLRQSDYTKKTQEAAEIRRTADALMQQAAQMAELQKAQAKQFGQLANLDEQIAQYEKVDWNTLTAQDATRAQQLFIAFQQAKDARQKVVQELNQSHEQHQQASQSAMQARLEEGQKALAREIKGWSADHGRKLAGFAVSTYGFTDAEVASVIDPRTVRMLNDAHQWRALQASKPAVEKKAVEQVATLKPKGSTAQSPNQQAYDADRRALRSAKDRGEQTKAAERLILRKLG